MENSYLFAIGYLLNLSIPCLGNSIVFLQWLISIYCNHKSADSGNKMWKMTVLFHEDFIRCGKWELGALFLWFQFLLFGAT